MRQAYSVLCPPLYFRWKTTHFHLFFGSGSSVGGLCSETGQLFEILQQTCPEGIVWLHSPPVWWSSAPPQPLLKRSIISTTLWSLQLSDVQYHWAQKPFGRRPWKTPYVITYLTTSEMPPTHFLSASLYFSKRGAYWDRLCRDVFGWLSRACTVAKRCILGL